MASNIMGIVRLRATISAPGHLKAQVKKEEELSGAIGIPRLVENRYTAGNGIVIENKVISLDELIIDCGTSTTVL